MSTTQALVLQACSNKSGFSHGHQGSNLDLHPCVSGPLMTEASASCIQVGIFWCTVFQNKMYRTQPSYSWFSLTTGPVTDARNSGPSYQLPPHHITNGPEERKELCLQAPPTGQEMQTVSQNYMSWSLTLCHMLPPLTSPGPCMHPSHLSRSPVQPLPRLLGINGICVPAWELWFP